MTEKKQNRLLIFLCNIVLVVFHLELIKKYNATHHSSRGASRKGSNGNRNQTEYLPFMATKHPKGFITFNTTQASSYPPRKGEYTEFLAFLRISKTASTSVMNFLSYDKQGLESLNSFIPQNLYETKKKTIYECFFATSNESKAWRKKKRRFGDCPHPGYDRLKEIWQDSISSLPSHEVKHKYYLHSFSMVRDPFERMVSFFYFMQINIPWWSASDKQDERILADDFFGWLDVIQQERRSSYIISHPFMHEAFHPNVDKAIELITGDNPEIMITSSDCVDMSLRLLANKKPQFFDEKRLDAFLHSDSVNSRKRDKSTTKNYFNQTLAREMHKKIFPEDWKFYNAAVKQMRKILLETDELNYQFGEEYATCIEKLNMKISESDDVLSSMLM